MADLICARCCCPIKDGERFYHHPGPDGMVPLHQMLCTTALPTWELEELRAKAARYDWLCRQHIGGGYAGRRRDNVYCYRLDGIYQDFELPEHIGVDLTLDQLIDAMKAKEQQNG